MNILSPHLQGCHWLDLCSGSGVMGCEALQRGAESVVAIEGQSHCRNLQAQSLDIKLGCGSTATVEVAENMISWLKRPCGYSGFDLVYLDPPYQSNLYLQTLTLLLQGQWLKENAIVICEHATNERIEPRNEWITLSRRRYGTTSLLMLSRAALPPRRYWFHAATNSPVSVTESDRGRFHRAEVRSSPHQEGGLTTILPCTPEAWRSRHQLL